MPALGNWVKMTYSSGGSGALTLTKEATHPSFNELLVGLGFCAATNTNVSIECHYDLVDETNGKYESGIGTFNPSTNILTRTLVQQTATTSAGVTTVDTTAPTAITADSSTSVYLGTTTNSLPQVIPGTGFTGTTFAAQGAPFCPMNYVAASGATSVTAVSGQEKWWPFLWNMSANIKTVCFYCNAGTTANVQIGIYECLDSGGPGALLWNSGTFTPTASTNNQRNISSGTPTALTLHPGWYWMVINFNNSTMTFIQAFVMPQTQPAGLDKYLAYVAAYTKTTTFGTLSNPGPALTALAKVNPSDTSTRPFPAIGFQVQA